MCDSKLYIKCAYIVYLQMIDGFDKLKIFSSSADSLTSSKKIKNFIDIDLDSGYGINYAEAHKNLLNYWTNLSDFQKITFLESANIDYKSLKTLNIETI